MLIFTLKHSSELYFTDIILLFSELSYIVSTHYTAALIRCTCLLLSCAYTVYLLTAELCLSGVPAHYTAALIRCICSLHSCAYQVCLLTHKAAAISTTEQFCRVAQNKRKLGMIRRVAPLYLISGNEEREYPKGTEGISGNEQETKNIQGN